MNPIDPLADAIAHAVLARLEPVLKAREGIRPRLMTVDQAAQYLGRTGHAIRNLHAGGQSGCADRQPGDVRYPGPRRLDSGKQAVAVTVREPSDLDYSKLQTPWFSKKSGGRLQLVRRSHPHCI